MLQKIIATLFVLLCLPAQSAPYFRAELIFPLHGQHNHAPSIVECADGSLLASWYRGSGERKADDVAVYGAWLKRKSAKWSDPFVMADTPGFPDGNTAMFIDKRKRLWLFWPVVIANSWESCLTTYRVAHEYKPGSTPKWNWQGTIYLKPPSFVEDMGAALSKRQAASPVPEGKIAEFKTLIGDKLSQRLGWQPRCKPTVLRSGRIIMPLYSDTYSVSIMAISDDEGQTWFASRPLVGFGNIQPAVLESRTGKLVAYMRENGPLNRIRVASSEDQGMTWGDVGVSELPNPGSGLDGLRLANGDWLLIYNNTTKGRENLSVSISDDEGQTWKWTKTLENQAGGSFHYPAIIQGRDGLLHAVYSYFVPAGKAMKHAAFDENWIKEK